MRSHSVLGLAAMLLVAAALPLSAAPADHAPPPDSAPEVIARSAEPVAVQLHPMEISVEITASALPLEALALEVGSLIAADSVALALERVDSVTALPALNRQTASARSGRQWRRTYSDADRYLVHLQRYSASHRPGDTSAYLTRPRS